MRIPKTNNVKGPSLFPFLSVLFCLIGTLMFIGVSIATTAFQAAAGDVRFEFKASDDFEPRLKPLFLMCTQETIASLDETYVFPVGPEETRVESLIQNRFTRGSSTRTGFTRFLSEVARADSQYVLFLVKPNTLESFETFRNSLEFWNTQNQFQQVDYSFELIPMNWEISSDPLITNE